MRGGALQLTQLQKLCESLSLSLTCPSKDKVHKLPSSKRKEILTWHQVTAQVPVQFVLQLQQKC